MIFDLYDTSSAPISVLWSHRGFRPLLWEPLVKSTLWQQDIFDVTVWWSRFSASFWYFQCNREKKVLSLTYIILKLKDRILHCTSGWGYQCCDHRHSIHLTVSVSTSHCQGSSVLSNQLGQIHQVHSLTSAVCGLTCFLRDPGFGSRGPHRPHSSWTMCVSTCPWSIHTHTFLQARATYLLL